MEIAATTNAASSAAASSRIGLADNFDNFLKLLTTQLENQDPLSPLDATQFTEQLVQFTGVEQAIRTNDALGQLITLVRADQIARAVDYLGAEVEAAAQTVRLSGADAATVRYRLDQPATKVVISVYDQAGRLVRTVEGEASPGVHAVPWDGRDQNGARLQDGLYRVEVAAGDAAGGAVPVSTTIAGIVDGVEVQGERLMLSVAGVLLPLEAITTIRRPAADA
jgi:flagellar basal-body rod modification protein FlgD